MGVEVAAQLIGPIGGEPPVGDRLRIAEWRSTSLWPVPDWDAVDGGWVA